MNPFWHSLYVPLGDGAAVAAALRQALQGQGYQFYDPFPGGTGFSFGWKRRVGLFVAPPSGDPPAEGWTRVLGEPDRDALPALATVLGVPVVQAWLADGGGGITVWTTGGRDDSPEALAAWLRRSSTLDDLRQALGGGTPAALSPESGPTAMAVPLPDDVRVLAGSVEPGRAKKLTDRLAQQLLGKGGATREQQAQAADLLGGEAEWNMPEGRRLRAVMACLSVPEGWQLPSFADVREAYIVARSRQRNPGGLPLPGDDQSLALVPDALEYIPVYAGLR